MSADREAMENLIACFERTSALASKSVRMVEARGQMVILALDMLLACARVFKVEGMIVQYNHVEEAIRNLKAMEDALSFEKDSVLSSQIDNGGTGT